MGLVEAFNPGSDTKLLIQYLKIKEKGFIYKMYTTVTDMRNRANERIIEKKGDQAQASSRTVRDS